MLNPVPAVNTAAFPANTRAAAQFYLERGVVPIPVPYREKGAILDDWPDLRPTAADLDRLFPPGRPMNVGLLTGEPSGGLVDVDLDDPAALSAAARLLPATALVSGRAGMPRSHRWFVVENPPSKASCRYEDLDGKCLIELRSTGGQTVVPPSVHKDTGENIVWHDLGEPARVELKMLHRQVAEVATVALLSRHWPGRGGRNDAYLALAGALIRAGWEVERVERFVIALAEATGDEEASKRVAVVPATAEKIGTGQPVTGWPRLDEMVGQEVVRRSRQWFGIAGPAQTAAATKTRRIDPYRPFLIDALPEPLRRYCVEAAAALGCDVAYVAVPALAVCGGLIGNRRRVRLKSGWTEPSVLWMAVVADSGTVKSPAHEKAVAPVWKIQRRWRSEYNAANQEHAIAQQAAKTAAKSERSEPPPQPVLCRVLVSDTTVERLAEVLDENPLGVLLSRDELNGWFSSFNQYKSKGGSDLANWLEMHRAGQFAVDRKNLNRKTLFVSRAAVSVTGTIQPRVLARTMTAEHREAGLTARLLLAMPPKLKKTWTEADIDPTTEAAYAAMLDGLLNLQPDADDDGLPIPRLIGLSPDAKQIWVEFYNDWGEEQYAAEGDQAAAFAKIEGYAARLALVHHLVNRASTGTADEPIAAESMTAGIALARWFAHEGQRVYATLGETEAETDTRRLVEWVERRGGTTTVRELQRSNSHKYPSAEDAERTLQRLVQAGLGYWQAPTVGPQGGQPATHFVLYATPDTTDSTAIPSDPVVTPSPDSGADTTPTTNGAGPEISSTVGSVGRRTGGDIGQNRAPETALDGQGGPVVSVAASPAAMLPEYVLVNDPAQLSAVIDAVGRTERIGLDLETTGLDPQTNRVRLLSLAVASPAGGAHCYLIDCSVVEPTPIWPVLAGKELLIHNAAFDLAFLAKVGFEPRVVRDTMLLAQLLTAGTNQRCRLEDCVDRELNVSLDKSLQKSDWSGRLTEDQLAYAARDAVVLLPLFAALAAKVRAAGLDGAAEIERRCLPAVVWMAGRGVPFDRGRWQELMRAAGEEAQRIRTELTATAGERNWGSPKQVKEALAAAGCPVPDTQDATLAVAGHPVADIVRRYRKADKLATSYGTKWLEHAADDGRLYADWHQYGALTGRMSVSQPSLQNTPRDAKYRYCFRSGPGRLLIKADFSQIELRIAAKAAGEQNMIDAYLSGEDLHTLTARRMTGKDSVTKDERQLAKPVNFGLIYGMGTLSLRRNAAVEFGVHLSESDAERYRQTFFETYPGIRRWHDSIRWGRATETRTLAGRRVLVRADDFYGSKANYVIQGTGGDGIKVALALLSERRAEFPGAFPVMAVHDEIVVECDADQANAVAAWLRQAMIDAMAPLIAPVPVEVEVQVGETWAG
jgi:DNA polymerase I-like protein with 3'-5' exonuclease and polymerase domains